jgi:hypothetical protein
MSKCHGEATNIFAGINHPADHHQRDYLGRFYSDIA